MKTDDTTATETTTATATTDSKPTTKAGRPRTKKAAPKKAAQPKAKSKAKPNEAKERGTADRYADEQVITLNAADNPRRPDSKQHAHFELIKRYRGKTVGAYRKAGGKDVYLRYAESQRHVSVE